VKKLKGFSDYAFLSLRLDKSLTSGKKYLTKYLICNNIIQYEESGSKESKFTEEDPGLFGNASGEPGGFISQMWKEGVSM